VSITISPRYLIISAPILKNKGGDTDIGHLYRPSIVSRFLAHEKDAICVHSRYDGNDIQIQGT